MNNTNSSNSKNRSPWVDEKPMVHIKNRLAKSTRYSRNALQYYQNALDVLSGNKTLATSFETFLDEAGRINNRGYSLRHDKEDEMSAAEMVMQIRMREGEVKETASLRPKKRKKKKKKKAGTGRKTTMKKGKKIS